MTKTRIIANPVSALGKTGNRIEALHAQLCQALGHVELVRTRATGDATRLAREAVAEGVDHIVVAGGDGTTSEVVEGLLGSEGGSRVALTPLPFGTGRDFARMMGLSSSLREAVRRATSPRQSHVDAARVRCIGADGQPYERYCINVTSWGMSGVSVRWVEGQSRRGRRGRLTYVKSGLYGIARYRHAEVRVEVDDALLYEGKLALGVAANGQYFGGGMKIAPHASPRDGVLDVLVVPGMPKLQLLKRFPKLLTGAHADSHEVVKLRGRHVKISSDEQVYVEVDGELAGTLPASIEILPSAVTLRGL